MFPIITYRLDDITPCMNWSNFNDIMSILVKHEAYPLLGIVPNNLDESLNVDPPNESFWREMRDLVKIGCTIAQHGYTHRYITNHSGILGINPLSEFAGRSYEEQFADIQNGKLVLQHCGLLSDIWMAPAHSFDEITLQALNDAGFKYVTDGYSFWPYEYNNLKFIPCQSSTGLNIRMGIQTICLHPNNMTGKKILQLEEYIVNNKAHVCPFHKVLTSKVYNYSCSRLFEKVALSIRALHKLIKTRSA